MNIEEMFVKRFIDLENENKSLKIRNDDLVDSNQKVGDILLKLYNLIDEMEPELWGDGSIFFRAITVDAPHANEYIDLLKNININIKETKK